MTESSWSQVMIKMSARPEDQLPQGQVHGGVGGVPSKSVGAPRSGPQFLESHYKARGLGRNQNTKRGIEARFKVES